jgi:hypothetical protein
LDINERLNEKNGNGAMGFLRGVPDWYIIKVNTIAHNK